MDDENTNEGVEAPTTINSINERGRVIDSDLVQIRGKTRVDYDKGPTPESMSLQDFSAGQSRRDGSDVIFERNGIIMESANNE